MWGFILTLLVFPSFGLHSPFCLLSSWFSSSSLLLPLLLFLIFSVLSSCTYPPHPELTYQTLIWPAGFIQAEHRCPTSHTSTSHTVNAATPPPFRTLFSHLNANTPWHLIGISFTSPLLPLTLPLHPFSLQQTKRQVPNNRVRMRERGRSTVIKNERDSETTA